MLVVGNKTKIIDLRNLYVQEMGSLGLVLVQHNFKMQINFQTEKEYLKFIQTAKKFYIRRDLQESYCYDLLNEKHQIGSGGFGDVRMIKHRKSRQVFALKTVAKSKINWKGDQDNSMR
jgi:hypothetical protein